MASTKKTKGTGGLCPPALVYLIFSVIGLLLSIFQNYGSKNVYKLAIFSMNTPNKIFIFIIKILVIAFWTWVLNLICKDGYTWVSWLLVLLPFILIFVAVGLVALKMPFRKIRKLRHKK